MRKNKNSLLIIISLIIICINHITLSKHKEDTNFEMNTKIMKPIIVLEKDEMIKTQIQENAFPIEYNFCIHNYNENEINEIGFDYVIEIESSVDNFPVTYQLFDCDRDEEIELIDGKSEKMKLKKSEKENRKFKLILNWRELDSDLADNLQINLKINAIQSEEEGSYEGKKNNNSVNSNSSYI